MQEKLVEQAKKGEACCPNIDGKTRFIGFIITIIIGLVLSILSIGSVFGIIFSGATDSSGSGSTWSAALLTIGNAFCISSTFFLYGPKKQCAKMIEPVRIMASIILVLAFIFSIVSAFCFPNWVTATAIVIQLLALIWYIFSYIPFAQDCLTKCTKQICCGCCMKGEASAGGDATAA